MVIPCITEHIAQTQDAERDRHRCKTTSSSIHGRKGTCKRFRYFVFGAGGSYQYTSIHMFSHRRRDNRQLYLCVLSHVSGGTSLAHRLQPATSSRCCNIYLCFNTHLCACLWVCVLLCILFAHFLCLASV